MEAEAVQLIHEVNLSTVKADIYLYGVISTRRRLAGGPETGNAAVQIYNIISKG